MDIEIGDLWVSKKDKNIYAVVEDVASGIIYFRIVHNNKSGYLIKRIFLDLCKKVG